MEKIRTIERYIRDFLSAEAEKVAPSAAWWDSALSRLGERKRRGFWSILIPKTRLAWALVPVIFLLFAGVVYGAVAGVQRLFELWAPDVETAGLSTPLNMSQTIDGITITLERAYADSNIILIGWSVEGAEGLNAAFGGTIITSDGLKIRPSVGMFAVPDKALGFSGHATIWQFDGSTIVGAPSELSLKLDISPIIFRLPDEEARANAEHYIFIFTLPFYAGKVIDVNQTIEAAGIPITLEKVVVSPSATRVFLRLYPPYDRSEVGELSLMFPSGTSYSDSANKFTISSHEDSGELVRCFSGNFTNQTGEWILSIKEIIDLNDPSYAGNHPASDTKRVSGPWVFHFRVP
jgi:hypothetical protein